ncbi:MAG: hypothetical protein VW683_10225 [Betaproteobacteria bacterium]|jgi:uncharacterized protein YoxC
MIDVLIITTCLAVLALLAIVALALIKLNKVLESIGGSGESFLAKLRLGLRAIERETSHLPSVMPDIIEDLNQINNGLSAVKDTVNKTYGSVMAQEN